MTAPATAPRHPLWGDLPGFTRDPLAFLSQCAQSGRRAVPLRLLHISAVLLLDPADIERVLVTEHRDFVKPGWLRTAAVRRLLGDGLVTSDGEAWRQQRHACQPAFHLRRMDCYGETITMLADRLLARWAPGQTVALQEAMSRLTLDVVAHTLLGVDAEDWTVEASEAMDTLMARFTAGVGFYGMAPLPPGLRELRAERQLNRVVDSLLRQEPQAGNGQEGTANRSLLAMLRAPRNTGGAGLSGRALREQVKTFLGAGYESSALTLTWAFLLLGRHPDADRGLYAELAALGRPPGPEDVSQLPYTLAVVKETLRLFPPLWMTGRESVRRCEIGGVNVPAGALIMTSQWVAHRQAAHFTSPDAFRPDRWLNGETDQLPRFAYFPFGGGPRVCIGQSFALMESVLLLATIVRRFRLEALPGPEIKPWATMTLRPPAGVRVRLASRQPG